MKMANDGYFHITFEKKIIICSSHMLQTFSPKLSNPSIWFRYCIFIEI